MGDGSEPILQHDVPDVYLRPWGRPHRTDKDDVVVFVQRKSKPDRRFTMNTRHMLRVKHLYTVFNEAGQPDYWIEKWFGKLEGDYGKIRSKVESGPSAMDTHARTTLAWFTAAQLYRTQNTGKMLAAQFKFLQTFPERPLTVFGPDGCVTFVSVEKIPGIIKFPFHNFYRERIAMLAHVLSGMKIVLLLSDPPYDFVTSDEPAMGVNVPRNGMGLQDTKSQMTLPISPRAKVAYNWDFEGVIKLTPDEVQQQNQMQIAVAHDYIVMAKDEPV